MIQSAREGRRAALMVVQQPQPSALVFEKCGAA